MGKSAINQAVVGKHSTDIAALKNDLGIVEDGDTATHTIAQGQYVIWQGVLYTADAAIASGTTLAASGGNKNLTAVENGGLNALNNNVPKSISFTEKSSYANYFDKTLDVLIGKKILAVYLDNNQWFGGVFGFNSSTGHFCVRFIDIGTGNAKTLNDNNHTCTIVYA